MAEFGTVTLHEHERLSSLKEPGDYAFVSYGETRKVVMACPACGLVFVCPHEIIAAKPLELRASVIGPVSLGSDQVLMTVCGHHFWVRDGKAVEVSGAPLRPTDSANG